MADSEFERFKKMFPRGTKDMNIQAIPAPLPGPGGIVRGVIGKGVQSGVRRFSDVNKGDKVTKMKDGKGLERKDPMEPRVVESGRSKSLEKTRQGGGGPTKMKDRKGLERKPERKAEAPPSKGMGKKVAVAGGATGAIVGGYMASKEMAKQRSAKAGVANDKSKPMSTADVQKSYQELNRKHGTQRPVTEQRRSVPARVKAKPADLMDSYKKKTKAKSAKPAKAKPAKKAQRVAFKGNWTNAAPTPMQKKAGMRKR